MSLRVCAGLCTCIGAATNTATMKSCRRNTYLPIYFVRHHEFNERQKSNGVCKRKG